MNLIIIYIFLMKKYDSLFRSLADEDTESVEETEETEVIIIIDDEEEIDYQYN